MTSLPRHPKTNWLYVGPVLIASVVYLLILGFMLFTGPVETVLFETGVGRALVALALFTCGWFVVVWLSRAIPNKDRAFAPLVLSLAFVLALLGVTLDTWWEADRGRSLSEMPVAQSEKEILDIWRQPFDNWRYGILAVGKIANADTSGRITSGGSEERVLWYDAKSNASSSHFVRFAVQMSDDNHAVHVDAPDIYAVWNWPLIGHYQHALKTGDDVVIWANPEKNERLTQEKAVAALSSPRIIAYGSWKDFHSGYMVTTSRTASGLNAIVLLMAMSAFLMLIAGLLGYRHIRRTGANTRSESITWS